MLLGSAVDLLRSSYLPALGRNTQTVKVVETLLTWQLIRGASAADYDVLYPSVQEPVMSSPPSAIVTVPDPLVEPLRDVKFLIESISEITGAPEAAVIERLNLEHRRLGSTVAAELEREGIKRYTWTPQLSGFYSQTDAFLYESTVWNRTAEKNEMRRWIASYLASQDSEPKRLLVFGDGLGFDSLYFSQAGHQIDFYDPSEDGGSFADRLFKGYGAKIRILANEDEVDDETYDVAVCLDVLEHVPSPPQLVARLARAIRPGGRLIVHAPFWYVSPAVSTHLSSNLQYSGDLNRLFRPYGLWPVAGRIFLNPLVLSKTSHHTFGEKPSTPKAFSTKRKSLPTTLRIGSLLLKTARIWNLPHVLFWKLRYNASWKPWLELDSLR
jgi:2-polyprenyl-3-methyl-5-hydroxy-6-metoxy-1,4-benzoquinol methylase